MIVLSRYGEPVAGIVLHGGLNFVSAHIGHAIVRAVPRRAE